MAAALGAKAWGLIRTEARKPVATCGDRCHGCRSRGLRVRDSRRVAAWPTRHVALLDGGSLPTLCGCCPAEPHRRGGLPGWRCVGPWGLGVVFAVRCECTGRRTSGALAHPGKGTAQSSQNAHRTTCAAPAHVVSFAATCLERLLHCGPPRGSVSVRQPYHMHIHRCPAHSCCRAFLHPVLCASDLCPACPRAGDNISVTKGIVSRIALVRYSATARLLSIQIDAAINPGAVLVGGGRVR